MADFIRKVERMEHDTRIIAAMKIQGIISNEKEVMNLSADRTIKRWYPVYTHSRAEKKAYQALCNKGVETYLPLQRELKRWSDRKKWVEEPFIKSYLFVYIAPKEQAEVLMTKGVSRFIYFSGQVCAMPDRQIEALRLLLASAYELEVTAENLMPGEQVTIKGGPLIGMRGEIIAYGSRTKFLVRFGDLQQSIMVSVPLAMIERA